MSMWRIFYYDFHFKVSKVQHIQEPIPSDHWLSRNFVSCVLGLRLLKILAQKSIITRIKHISQRKFLSDTRIYYSEQYFASWNDFLQFCANEVENYFTYSQLQEYDKMIFVT